MTSTIVPPLTTTRPSTPRPRGSRSRLRDRAARAIVTGALERFGGVSWTVHEQGSRHTVGTARHGDVSINVHDPAAWSSVLAGSVGLGRSYIEGSWDADDLVAVLRAALQGVAEAERRLPRAIAVLRDAFTRSVGRIPSKDTDRGNIRAHYDLSNEFFALFLDGTMTYSCAVFESPDSALIDATEAKLDRLCRKLDLRASDHLLEIGTGWGSLAIYAARRYGCRVTTTTISDQQLQLARERVAEEGLEHLVTVLGADYRELTGIYDKVVSVEMIEAVDWRQHDVFFNRCSRLLAPGGTMAIQAIVIDDRHFDRSKRRVDFIKEFIFPGGCLPSVEAIARSSARAGLRITDVEDIGLHYAETVARWRANLDERGAEVDALGFGVELRRMWDFYFAYCQAAFLERRVSCVQTVLTAREWRASRLETRPC